MDEDRIDHQHQTPLTIQPWLRSLGTLKSLKGGRKKFVSEAGKFHATMLSKPKPRSGFENFSSYGQGF
jgi:hypothetical protein